MENVVIYPLVSPASIQLLHRFLKQSRKLVEHAPLRQASFPFFYFRLSFLVFSSCAFVPAPIVIIVIASLLILVTIIRWIRLQERPIKARATQSLTDMSHMSPAEKNVLQAQAGLWFPVFETVLISSFLHSPSS